MTDEKLLQQEEIDALLKAAQGEDPEEEKQSGQPEETPEAATTETQKEEQPPAAELTPKEKDALGEIGNICMGSAATTLSQLLNKRVLITSPEVYVTTQQEFFNSFNTPFLAIKVKFKEGFSGYNVLIIKQHDAMVMASLMMGGDGTDLPEELSEMEISAAAEAMNQMIGTASTSLADLVNRNINIFPPETTLVKDTEKPELNLPFADPVVVISFRMHIEDMLDTNIMQVMDIDTAREQSRSLWQKYGLGMEDTDTGPAEEIAATAAGPPGEETAALPPEQEVMPGGSTSAGEDFFEQPVPGGAPAPPQVEVDQEKLNLLLDIPLRVSVVLGRTRRPIKDVLKMTPGAIVELESMVDEPVDILVNGKLIAKGEVVVVNENFGVKITSIISTKDRINSLSGANEN